MGYYILKLVIMLPLMAAMIFGALWLYRKYQPGLSTTARHRDLRLVDTLPMGTAGKLAVVEFGNERILVAATRGRIERISSEKLTEQQIAERAAAVAAAADGEPSAVSFRDLMDRAMERGRRLRGGAAE